MDIGPPSKGNQTQAHRIALYYQYTPKSARFQHEKKFIRVIFTVCRNRTIEFDSTSGNTYAIFYTADTVIPTVSRFMEDSQKAISIGMLMQVGEAYCRTVGPQCEVVIHDLADMEQSIVWTMGNVTERKVGGCLTSRGLSLVHAGKTDDSYNYTTRTRSGKLVRSSLAFVKDEYGQPFACVEVNLDTTPFIAFQQVLRSLADPDELYDFHNAFIDSAPEMLETMLQEAISMIGKSPAEMSKTERLRVVQMLDEGGAFEFRKAVSTVAKYLDVTRHTIHNYLNEIRGTDEPSDSELD
jgi:predicted transcriptional regulator YheO